MEIKADGFANPVETVARELLGPKFLSKDQPRNHWIRTYLPVLRDSLDPKHIQGRDEVSFSHNVLSLIKPFIDPGVLESPQGVSWTVAAAILMEDEALKVPEMRPVYVRYLFDLSLGVAVSDYASRHETALRNAAYDNDPKSRRQLLDYSEHSRGWADRYRYYQEKLREPEPQRASIDI